MTLKKSQNCVCQIKKVMNALMIILQFTVSVEDPEAKGGLSKDKCDLAMSFFANAGAKPAKKQQPTAKKSTPKTTELSEDGLPLVQNASARPFVKERAYYEPEEDSNLDLDDEEDDIPDFQARRKNRENSTESAENPPKVPTRSVNSDNTRQGMMLRLLKNTTNILKS